jgi:hypothetical protein
MQSGRAVVVPHSPGPLVPLDRPQRGRDDLDELIDELFPDTDEGPGWFDAGLVALAAGLVGWRVAGGPTAALVAGGAALALGCILPLRWVGQRLQRRRHRRRREAIAATGVLLHVANPATAGLVQAYDDLAAVTGTGSTAGTAGAGWHHDAGTDAAHGALLEVATLLRGRAPGSDGERDYVTARAVAIEGLTAAVREARDRRRAGGRADADDVAGPDPALVVEARRELEAMTGNSALSRLDELTTEARHGRGA